MIQLIRIITHHLIKVLIKSLKSKFRQFIILGIIWLLTLGNPRVLAQVEHPKNPILAHYDVSELEAVEKTLRDDPNNAAAYQHRGLIRSHSQEDFTGAIDDFSQAIRLDPKAETYNYRGTSYFWLGNYQQALEDYNQAIKLDPNLAIAYYNRAYAKLELKDKPGAIADFRQGAMLSQQQGDLFSYQQALELIEDLKP